MCFTIGSHLSSLFTISSGKVILRDVPSCLPQVSDSYDRQFKFDSVLHTEFSDNVLYGFSAINVELSELSISRSHRLK